MSNESFATVIRDRLAISALLDKATDIPLSDRARLHLRLVSITQQHNSGLLTNEKAHAALDDLCRNINGYLRP